MEHYLDIHLRPIPELSASVLMNGLYAQLHKVLVQIEQQNKQGSGIGVSFPKHQKKHLGEHLRLHGTQAVLTQLQAPSWVSRAMADMVQLGGVQSIPDQVQHRVVRRVQAKSNPERIRRRLVKRLMQREGLELAIAQERVKVGTEEQRLNLPFLSLQSTSTGERFRLFIEHGRLESSASLGVFNAYGLSQTATIPWF